MKPYLAILIDSYWETVTSKVLWALLIGWSILLAGLAPFGYISESSYRMVRGDVNNRQGLAQKLAKGLTPAGTAAQKAISKHLSPGLKKQLEAANAITDSRERNERFVKISAREMIADLNNLLTKPELYDPEAFPSAAHRKRTKDIVAKPANERTPQEVEALNRVLIDIAYSADMAAPRNEQLWIGYAGIKLGDALPFDRATVNTFVERIALEIIIRLGLSFVAVFVGLIVTSPMIPETFRSGSLHLLLSKPVSRPLIYLTKFFGGTLFVLFNIAFLLTGLFLLVGWRLGIWNTGLILCIPLLLFVFVIFYSVSALVGLIWNNPIICVVVCIVFWVFCLIIGVLESSLRIPAQWTPQIVRFLEVEKDIIAVTQAGAVKVWNDEFRVWQPAADLNEGASGRVLGPYYDAERKRLVMRSDFLDGLGSYATRSRNLVYADLQASDANEPTADQAAADTNAAEDATPTKAAPSDDAAPKETAPSATAQERSELANSSSSDAGASTTGSSKPLTSDAEETAIDDDLPKPKTAEEARRKQRWPSENGIEPPMLMLDLITFGDRSLAISRNGIFEIDWAAHDAVESAKSAGGVFGNVASWLGRFQPQPFKDLTPVDYTFGEKVSIAKSPDEAMLFVISDNSVDALALDATDGRFKVESTFKFEGEEEPPSLIAAGSGHCVVARESSPLILLPRDLSRVEQTISIPGDSDVRQLQVIGNSDRFSIVTHAGDWYQLDASTAKLTEVASPWQSSITGVTWMSDEDEMVWVGIKPNRAALLDLASGRVERSLEPSLSRLDLFYRWIARPLYVINPKPSALNGVLQKLLSKEGVGQTQLVNNDLSSARVEVEIWQPIISNLLFVTILLTAGCIYVWRREF